MHFEVNFLEIAFQFMLFGLLAYKLWEYMKAYLVPTLYEAIDEEKKYRTDILEKEKLLISTHHRIENQISQQKKTFFLLEKNVKSWHQALEASRDERLKEDNALLQQIQTKRRRQQRHLEEILLMHEVLPKTIRQAQEKLQKKFMGAPGKQVLSKMITSIDQEARHT